MNREMVAKEVLKIARELMAIDFNTQDELDAYLKKYPGADRSKHRVLNKTKKAPSETGFHQKAKPSKGALGKVKNVLRAHGLAGDESEVHEMAGFKKKLGQRVPKKDWGKFYARNEQKLKADFIKNMNPQSYDSPEAFNKAKDRMKKMPVSDFGKILAAITDEEV